MIEYHLSRIKVPSSNNTNSSFYSQKLSCKPKVGQCLHLHRLSAFDVLFVKLAER